MDLNLKKIIELDLNLRKNLLNWIWILKNHWIDFESKKIHCIGVEFKKLIELVLNLKIYWTGLNLNKLLGE